MTDFTTIDAYGVITEPATLTIRRLLPGPIERVWAYLTESDLRRQWLASGDMDMRVGAPFELSWHNDELTVPPGVREPGFDDPTMISEITVLEPPHRIGFTWGSTGGVLITLEAQGEDVLLTLTHSRLSDAIMRNVAPGWHTHLDILVARVAGHGHPPFWDAWRARREEYAARMAG